MSDRSRLIALLLSLCGFLGLHRFYLGRVWTGLLMLVTVGGLGLWWILDIILVLSGRLNDSHGFKLMWLPKSQHSVEFSQNTVLDEHPTDANHYNKQNNEGAQEVRQVSGTSTISLPGQTKVTTLQDRFKDEFGLTLRVYDGRSFAEPDATIGQVRKKRGPTTITIRENARVGNVENRFMEDFGIKVQIAGSDDSYLCKDDLTLAAALEEDRSKIALREKRTNFQSVSTAVENYARLSFQLKRAQVDLDQLEDEYRDYVQRLVKLCDSGQHDTAAADVLESLQFEFDFDGMDGDPTDYFAYTSPIEIDCSADNTHVRVSSSDGTLVLTIETWFDIEVVKNRTAEEVQEYLDDNGGWSAGGYFPFAFTGDDGTNIWLTSLRGVQVDFSDEASSGFEDPYDDKYDNEESNEEENDMKVSVDVYTKDVDAALAAFKFALEHGAEELRLSSNHDWETKKFEHLNLMFDADHTSEAISQLDDGPFSKDTDDL